MSLDSVFGAGSTSTFAEKVNLGTLVAGATTSIREITIPNGVFVQVDWATAKGVHIATYKLEFLPPNVHCGALIIEPTYRSKGLLTQLCRSLEPWWVSIGLKTHTVWAAPGSNAQKQLALCGFGEHEKGWGVELPAIKTKEYLAWVQEGSIPANEPAWRKELSRPTEESF